MGSKWKYEFPFILNGHNGKNVFKICSVWCKKTVSVQTLIRILSEYLYYHLFKSQLAQHFFLLISCIKIFGTYNSIIHSKIPLCQFNWIHHATVSSHLGKVPSTCALCQNEEMLLLPEVVQAAKLGENGCASVVVPCSSQHSRHTFSVDQGLADLWSSR